MFLISSLTFHVRLSHRWAFFCQSLSEINITVQQLDEVGREVKLCTHIGGGHYAEKHARRSSLMILLVSRSNAGSAPRDRREGSVGPSEGRATVTRSSVVFGLALQSEID